MTLPIDKIVFHSRALAQAHPFTPQAQAYLKSIVAREQSVQPAPDIGIWAGYALTVGYCLRRVEENDTAKTMDFGETLEVSSDLDESSSEIADLIRTEKAEGLLLYPEPLVIEALDRIIAGEIERRLSNNSEQIDAATFEKFESYLAWWVIKGYAVRIAELVAPQDASAAS